MPSKRPLQANIPNPGTVYIVSHLPLPPVKPARRVIFQHFFRSGGGGGGEGKVGGGVFKVFFPPPPPPPLLTYSTKHVQAHVRMRTHMYTRAYAHAYTCEHTRAYVRARARAYAPWGEIRRTSRCDTAYHYPRYAVSLFDPPAGSGVNVPEKCPYGEGESRVQEGNRRVYT